MASSESQRSSDGETSFSELPSSDTSPSEITLISTDGSLTTLDEFRGEICAARMRTLTDLEIKQSMLIQARQMAAASYRKQEAKNDESAVDLSHDLECSDINSTDEDEKMDLPAELTSNCTEQNENATVRRKSENFERLCDLDNENTRELLKHYLENSESVDELKIYKMEPSKYVQRLIQYVLELFQFLLLVFSSKRFWHMVLLIANVFAAVFFYLVLAASTVIVMLLLNLYEALIPPGHDEEPEKFDIVVKKEMPLDRVSPNSSVDELSVSS